ncbi:Bug family tripartite tricarboxylate transporter substrate binding protein [Pseudorhodoferax sp.]|uniref:Bug family tripartite tricarboxylate transporter substrate binding protein n=1 Tax=Pseudorhodoferax sp. TaxID=1993553 RepID=UPI002DD65F13|nr:tripartite tricarboxylate transporter substrate binding protein [Pseudorhodoferax sp.]
MRMTRRALLGLLCASGAAMAPWAQAQDGWPRQPITIVVPLSPGGVTDVVARYVGQRLSESLKVPVIIENRAGAGGGLAAEYVAKMPADGQTLIMGTVSSHAINASLYRSLRYDNLKDFEAVSLVASGPNLLVVHPSLPVKTVPELVQYLKDNPGKVSYGSTGVGTSTHVLAELFKMKTGSNMVHIPYKGSGAMVPDLIGGQVQLAFDNMPTALAQVKAGKLRALGVTSSQRWSTEPGIPTISESLPDFVATSWQGLFAPAGTPAAVLDRLAAEVQRILEAPDTVKRFESLGTHASPLPRVQFKRFVEAQTTLWAEVVKVSGARAD